MPFEPANELTFGTLLSPISSATNNAASGGFDLRGYVDPVAVRVSLGVKTAGDNDGAITVILQSAANNTASEATNLAVGTGLIGSTTNVATTNNTAAAGTLSVDPRACFRYIFARRIISGTNSPAYPVSATVVGKKQIQP